MTFHQRDSCIFVVFKVLTDEAYTKVLTDTKEEIPSPLLHVYQYIWIDL